ncbi:unnamed protein product [Calypogeia fissa]
MNHTVRDDCDRNHNSPTLGQSGTSWRALKSCSSFPGVRAAPSECMSGTLGDVFLFRGNGGFPGVVATAAAAVEDHASSGGGGMSLDEKDRCGGGGLSNKLQRKDSNNALGNTNIEWQQRLKEGVNAGNRSMFGDSGRDSGNFPVLNQQQTFHFMGSIGVGGGGGGAGSGGGSPWDCPRADSTAVNYLQAFGPVPTGSNGGVDGQLGEIRLAADGQQQILTDVLSRSGTSTCEVATEVAGGVKEEEQQFGGGADSSSTIGSHVLQGGGISNSGQQQQLFGTPHGLMPSPASMQQLNRSPNHAIRNLFPEKASNFSSAMLQQSHDDLGGNKVVDEQGLLQLTKKPRMQDFGDGGPGSSPLPIPDVENASRLSHGGASAGQYRKSSTFAHDQRSNALASLIDCSSSYNKSSPTSFSPSYAPGDRSTGFNSSNLSSLQNPSTSFSTFQPSGCLPMKNNASNENMSMKSPIVDYGAYPLDTSNRMQGGGDYRPDLLDRDAFLGVSSPQAGLNFMPLVGSIGSGPFNFSSCRRQSSLDPLGRAAWPTGLLSSIPSLSMETPLKALLPSKRTLHDREQPEVLLDDREGRRVHPQESRRRMLIQKQLTTTDVGSLGRIILPKKEAETHLPHLPDKEGIEMYMYDYEADRTWTVKYRFWPNNKSRMYLLENTGEFAKFHALQQGDWLFIYRESPNRYVLRAKKSAPLLQVTPSSQSVTEPPSAAAAASAAASGGPAAAAPPAEDVGGPASASGSGSGRTPTTTSTVNQSSSPASTTDGGAGGGGGSGISSSNKEMVVGGGNGGGGGTTTATTSSSNNNNNQHSSIDGPPSRFAASSTGASPRGGKCNPPHNPHIVVPEARKPLPQPHPHHPHHHHQQQHPQQQQHEQLSSGALNSNNKHNLVHHLQSVVRAAPPGSRGAMEDDQHHHHGRPQQQHQQQHHQQHHQHQHQHQELRLKNYMAVQQQQQPDHHDMPSELEGGGDFNLEDFPRLIEADDETIDNILGHSSESHSHHVSMDMRSRSSTLSLRGGGGGGGRGEEESSSSRRSI